MIESVLLILIGAAASGAFQFGYSIFDRRREAETILTAIASEVDSICRLIRHQRYLEFSQEVADQIRQKTWDGASIMMDIRENYFSVYEGLASKLGMIKPSHAIKIVNFYAYCKSIIDSTRPDGVNATDDGNAYAAANMLSVEALLTSVLNLGDEIIKFPKEAIHPLEAGEPVPQSADLPQLPKV